MSLLRYCQDIFLQIDNSNINLSLDLKGFSKYDTICPHDNVAPISLTQTAVIVRSSSIQWYLNAPCVTARHFACNVIICVTWLFASVIKLLRSSNQCVASWHKLYMFLTVFFIFYFEALSGGLQGGPRPKANAVYGF